MNIKQYLTTHSVEPSNFQLVQLDKIEKNNINVYSACLFLINIIAGYKYKYNLYTILFTLLWITSVIYHSNPNNYTYYIDQVAVFSVVFYGGYIFCKNCIWTTILDKFICICIIATFLGTIFLYHYGKKTNTLCKDPCKKTGQLYHALLHGLTSIGHLMIMFL